MAPIRRYLRISKYSVLEVRIYIEGNPSLAETWLLRKSAPALPRIIEAIRNKVLPNLREENARAKNKGKSKVKPIKDVVKGDDFQVSIFLKDQTARHSLLAKQKNFTDKAPMKSNSGKLTNWLTKGTDEAPIDLEADDVHIRVEEEGGGDEERFSMSRIPEAPPGEPAEMDSDDALFVHSSDSDEDLSAAHDDVPSSLLKERTGQNFAEDEADDDKKKLGLQMSYDGFAIYGKILCLVVKRIAGPASIRGSESGQAMMENWVSTQVAQEMGLDQEVVETNG